MGIIIIVLKIVVALIVRPVTVVPLIVDPAAAMDSAMKALVKIIPLVLLIALIIVVMEFVVVQKIVTPVPMIAAFVAEIVFVTTERLELLAVKIAPRSVIVEMVAALALYAILTVQCVKTARVHIIAPKIVVFAATASVIAMKLKPLAIRIAELQSFAHIVLLTKIVILVKPLDNLIYLLK